MSKIKIVSNPYEKSLEYYTYKVATGTWADIRQDNPNSKLLEIDKERVFLPFVAKEIVSKIVEEYDTPNGEKIGLVFEGTSDEYAELLDVCEGDLFCEKISLSRSDRRLENARDILDGIKDIFKQVRPIIDNVVREDDSKVIKELAKVSDALKDIIPVCIFGNYSAGKSTFINALVGHEILPSGGDPVTSKIFEIKRSRYDDRARISFSYRDDAGQEWERYELQYGNTGYRLIEGNDEKEIVGAIRGALDGMEEPDFFQMVRTTIQMLNDYEDADKSSNVIDNVITIEVPFNAYGKFGNSRNEFVIFDTPGSNSNSNAEHSVVLSEAMDGFSNGIPVWVSTYDNLDTNDNAELCDRILGIEALDRRFTMIVVNRADQADFDGDCLSKEQEDEIKEYKSVEKMYACGIFFVSSIMGLGSKLDGELKDKFYRKTFKQQAGIYLDADDEYYTSLYRYNIMPEQIKERMLDDSEHSKNLIYANSGLYCIEEEIEEFASKYAAYNKCQMVYNFLQSIISATTQRIEEKIHVREDNKNKREQELDQMQQKLISDIEGMTGNDTEEKKRASKNSIAEKESDFLQHSNITTENLQKMEKEFTERNQREANYDAYQRDFDDAKSSRLENLKGNSKDLMHGNLVESAKSLVTNFVSDSKEIQQKRASKRVAKRSIDKSTSDSLMDNVVAEFEKDVTHAQGEIEVHVRKYWQIAEDEYRMKLRKMITHSDALTEQQKEKVSDIIIHYEPFVYDSHADEMFIKERFLRGNIMGLQIWNSERLDINRLLSTYKYRLKKCVKEMSQQMNNDCLERYKAWQENLLSTVEENITDYNPELKELSRIIREETDTIWKLQGNKQTIVNSMASIEGKMAWKELA